MIPAQAPVPNIPADWTPVEPFPPLGEVRRSFISGEPAGDRLRVTFYERPGDRVLYAKAWFGPGAEGPPTLAHGGSIMGVLDEVMGAVCWRRGLHVVAARLCTDFRHGVDLGVDATCEAWIEEINGRKVTARSRMYRADGTVLAESDGLFIILDPARLDALIKKAER